MIDLKALQKRIYENKVEKGFNTQDIFLEFCYTYNELSEACEAYIKHQDDVGEELADTAIFLLGLAEILGIDLEKEIVSKIEKNEKTVYAMKNGVLLKEE